MRFLKKVLAGAGRSSGLSFYSDDKGPYDTQRIQRSIGFGKGFSRCLDGFSRKFRSCGFRDPLLGSGGVVGC